MIIISPIGKCQNVIIIMIIISDNYHDNYQSHRKMTKYDNYHDNYQLIIIMIIISPIGKPQNLIIIMIIISDNYHDNYQLYDYVFW